MAPTSDKKAGVEAVGGEEIEYTRLHITPFNPSLLSAIVPPSLAPRARNISFHGLQAFPEKEYGFVDLPAAEATRISKKLNGAILRGTKIVIEAAREGKKRVSPDPETDMGAEKKEKKEKKERAKGEKGEKSSKKRKRHDEPMKGAEVLDRQIKRGWTDPNANKKAEKERRSKDKKERKKEREKSKYTTAPECLFRTTLPPSIAAALPAKGIEGVILDKKDRKKRNVVLHEFAKTEKFATFLRQKSGEAKGKQAVEFVEGKGWVDEDGEMVEGEPRKSKHNDDMLKEIAKKNKISKPVVEVAEESDSAESGEESDAEEADTTMPDAAVEESETSSSGSSSEDEEDSSESEAENEKDDTKLSPIPEDEPAAPSRRSSVSSGLTLSIPPSTADEPIETTSVHPLEALYKRRKPDANAPALPADPSFTFFGGDADNSDIEEDTGDAENEHTIPMTPFTSQEFSMRGMRSAAPTPDTAHPAKKHLSWPANDEEEEEQYSYGGGQQASSPTRKGHHGEGEATAAEVVKEGTDPNTDFQKWFYENRGDTDRAWKKRRKDVKKEVRQRENRKKGGGGGGA